MLGGRVSAPCSGAGGPGSRTGNKHHLEKRFSDMTREEQEVAAEELMSRVRARPAAQRTIEGQAEEITPD
jgi:hypothetical protein